MQFLNLIGSKSQAMSRFSFSSRIIWFRWFVDITYNHTERRRSFQYFIGFQGDNGFVAIPLF